MSTLRCWSLAVVWWTASAVHAQHANDLYMATCSQVIPCLAHYPLPRYGSGRPPSGLIPGLVVNSSRTARPGDNNCPSGGCVILDPGRLCDAYNDDCVPLPNIPTPHLPCDRRNPDCPPNGIYVHWDRTCHPADSSCAPGSVVSNPQACRNGDSGCSNCVRLPPWRTVCGPGDSDSRCTTPGQTFITNPVDPNYPCGCKPRASVPGVRYPWPPTICDPSTSGCTGKEHVVPVNRNCTVGEPGCIARDLIEPCIDGSADPRCPSGSKCCLVRNEPCHPNDQNCRGIRVDPIPCAHGTPKCENGIKLPDPPITGCRPSDPICQSEGPSVPLSPQTPPDVPHFPANNGRLIYNPHGSLKCSFVPDGESGDGTKEKYPTFPGTPGSGQLPITTDPNSGHRDGPDYQDHPGTVPGSAPGQPIPDSQRLPGYRSPTDDSTGGSGGVGTPQEGAVPPHPDNSHGQEVVGSPPATPPSPPPPPVPPPPTSKFPCSTDDKSPCKGSPISDWHKGRNMWSRGKYEKPGNPAPADLYEAAEPFVKPTILEVVDGKHQTSHYAIMVDGQIVAESDEGKVYKQEKLACSSGDDCVAKGLGHAFALIPAGQHDVKIAVTDCVTETSTHLTYIANKFYYRLFEACDGSNCPARI